MRDQLKDNVTNIAASPEKQTPPLQPPAPEEPLIPDPKPDIPAAQPEIPPPAPMPPVVPGIPMPGPPPEVGMQNAETVIQSAGTGGWAQATGVIWERGPENINTKDIREHTLVGGF